MSDDKKSSPLRTWLLLSLLLNVFLVGGIAGGAWRWWATEAGAARAAPLAQVSGGTPTAAAAQRGLRFAADGLSSTQAQAFRSGLRDIRRDSTELIRASRDGRIEVARLLAAPDFDRAAVDAQLARTRAADIALRERVEAQVVGFAATLSPGDRVTLVQGLSAQQGSFRVPPPPAKP
jgi:uncharacterized membrane protein